MLVLTALFCSALLLIDEPPPDKPKGTMLVGEHKKGDQVLFMMDIRKKATEGVILTQYVHYPPPNVFRNQTINLIAVLQFQEFQRRLSHNYFWRSWLYACIHSPPIREKWAH